MSRRTVLVVLAMLVVAGGIWRGYWAAHPGGAQSADERSYGTLAISLWRHHSYGSAAGNDLHWPPGAPLFFAPAVAFNDAGDDARRDVPAARWEQFAVGTALIVVVFLIAEMLAGSAAGLAAAAIIAFYAPLARNTAELLSEPLGGLLLACAVLGLVAAWRGPPDWRRFALAGGLFGLTVLTRADLLPAPFLLAALTGAVLWRRTDLRAGLLHGGALAAGVVVVILPWTIYATARANELVPVTQGDGAALFVGSYLPGDGTRTGMKRALEAEVRAAHPSIPKSTPAAKIDAALVLDTVAARNPGLERNESLRKEANRNLRRYLAGDPLSFAAMAVRKTGRMWLKSSRAGSRVANPVTRTWHWMLVITMAFALIGAVVVRRSVELGSILLILATSTGLHAVFVANPRYALPLIPILVAGGVSAIALALAGRRAEPGGATP